MLGGPGHSKIFLLFTCLSCLCTLSLSLFLVDCMLILQSGPSISGCLLGNMCQCGTVVVYHGTRGY